MVQRSVPPGGGPGAGTSKTIEISGAIALLIGGLCLALAYLLHPPEASPAIVASHLWIFVHVGFMISLVGGVFGLMALLSRYLRMGGGHLGLAGFGMGVLSLIFIFGLDYAEVFIFPVLAVEFPVVVERYGDGTTMPSLAFAFPLTGLLFVLGFLIFCYELFRMGASKAIACGVTMLGVVVFGVGLSGFVPMIVARVGASVFGFGLVLLGWGLLATPRSEQPDSA